jgi:hypothetical protein
MARAMLVGREHLNLMAQSGQGFGEVFDTRASVYRRLIVAGEGSREKSDPQATLPTLWRA